MDGHLWCMTLADQRETRLDTEPDEGKLESPTQLDSRSWRYVVRRTWREFTSDQCTDLAAALTYYAILALFPAAIALMSLLGLVGQDDSAVDEVLSILKDLGGGSIVKSIQDPLIALSQSQSAGLALVLGLAGALWSASGYVGAFGRAMNRIYEVGEGRPIWKLRPVMLLLTVVLVVLAAAVLLALVLTGSVAQTVGEALGLGSTGILLWQIAKWPALLLVVVFIVALLYYATPNIRQPRFRWVSVGALLAILTWVAVSAAFGFYVANFGSYDRTYGTLGGVIVFLLWLWLTNLALLFGAELDSELERGRELQSGLAAEETLQLPPRDTRKLEKDRRGEEKDLQRARELRLSHGNKHRRQDEGDG